jgi:hypothetical protein
MATTDWTVRGSNAGGGRDFPHVSRLALGPNKPPVQLVQDLSWGVESGRGVMLTPHPFLVPRSKKQSTSALPKGLRDL